MQKCLPCFFTLLCFVLLSLSFQVCHACLTFHAAMSCCHVMSESFLSAAIFGFDRCDWGPLAVWSDAQVCFQFWLSLPVFASRLAHRPDFLGLTFGHLAGGPLIQTLVVGSSWTCGQSQLYFFVAGYSYMSGPSTNLKAMGDHLLVSSIGAVFARSLHAMLVPPRRRSG